MTKKPRSSPEPGALIDALLAAVYGSRVSADLAKTDWLRWERAMEAIPEIFKAIEMEIADYEATETDHAVVQHWKDSFKAWLARSRAVVDDPFFDL